MTGPLTILDQWAVSLGTLVLTFTSYPTLAAPLKESFLYYRPFECDFPPCTLGNVRIHGTVKNLLPKVVGRKISSGMKFVFISLRPVCVFV
ncbi:hypothetical protein TNIN_217481 [Trichonephila inaurata madagascariensis]|uniref:Uncharacterized protein n=1 Tax=Trichonephila inaurata madagascariensis TaxID=2747483 RepID=A0A8X6J7B0_9ARAC|nr:hypothetical protein TNIN_217481 [Trichonephila inaurata madagascariensis]